MFRPVRFVALSSHTVSHTVSEARDRTARQQAPSCATAVPTLPAPTYLQSPRRGKEGGTVPGLRLESLLLQLCNRLTVLHKAVRLLYGGCALQVLENPAWLHLPYRKLLLRLLLAGSSLLTPPSSTQLPASW